MDPSKPVAGVQDALLPTNLLAAAACWCGIFSVLVCPLGVLLGPAALVMGILSLKRGAVMAETSYGKAASSARSWIGMISGALGTLIGIGVIVRYFLSR